MKQQKAEKLHNPNKEPAPDTAHNNVMPMEIVRGKQKGQSECYRNANRDGPDIGEIGKAERVPVP